ncbi:MAG: response regulator transcription factor [Gammaproteobacteria bacterium]|nr:response regulator transcription factor [Gammaproteobacteria bacterium]MDE2350002.1 response regulator transcription factor [Gammaproteobacteria bacterium]
MRILLVEDDYMLGSATRVALADAAHAVEWVMDGGAAVAALAATAYEAVVLDLGLPRRDGLEVLKTLRGRDNLLPVIVATARDSIADRVRGLDCGADDYLAKPFSAAELLARLRAVSRRRPGGAPPVLTNGPVTLDPATRVAAMNGRSTPLSTREYALLYALMRRPGIVLSRTQIERLIYGSVNKVDSNAVEFLIHGIRRRLGRAAIRNIRGVGWILGDSEQRN